MQKPIKPPRPNNTPPSRIKEIKTVVINRGDSLDLVPAEKMSIQNVYTDSLDKRVFEFIQDSIDSIGLCNIIENFKICVAEYGEIYVYLYCQQSEEFYKKELLEFENRFENYRIATIEYEKNLELYEDYSRKQRIENLEKELNYISGNKS